MQVLLLGLYAVLAGLFIYRYIKLASNEYGFNNILTGIAIAGFSFLTIKQLVEVIG